MNCRYIGTGTCGLCIYTDLKKIQYGIKFNSSFIAICEEEYGNLFVGLAHFCPQFWWEKITKEPICIDSLVSVNTLGISAMQLIGINKISFAVRPVLLL